MNPYPEDRLDNSFLVESMLYPAIVQSVTVADILLANVCIISGMDAATQ